MFMKNSLRSFTLLVLFLCGMQLNAATTRNDIKLNEASEDIKFISQKIAKEYLYLSLNKQKQETIDSISNSVVELDEKIRMIASLTKTDDAKNVLTFLMFSRDEINEIVAEKYSVDNALIMLDNSEVLIEGAESIASEFSYKFSDEEKMFIKVKYMSYIVQRISKYYMAIQAGFDDAYIQEQLKKSVANFDKELLELKLYEYDSQGSDDFLALQKYWTNSKTLFLTLGKSNIPNVIYITSGQLEILLEKLKLYHSKNQ